MLNRLLRAAPPACAFAFLLSTIAAAQSPQTSLDRSAPTDSVLAPISARGRAIAGYERAVWGANAKLLASAPDSKLVQRYVAFRTDTGWTVAFGELSASRDTFFVSHLAAPSLIDGCRIDSVMHVETLAVPRADTGYLARAARAIDTAAALFGPTRRPYDRVVLAAPDGSWWVYLLPAPDGLGSYPLGNDVRYRVTADARQVLEARRLHLGIVEFDRSNRPDAQYAASSHNTQVGNLPEDTDVSHVLTRRPLVLGYVFTTQFLYMINEDGSMRLVMPRMNLIGARR
jgi:hypothetical protein